MQRRALSRRPQEPCYIYMRSVWSSCILATRLEVYRFSLFTFPDFHVWDRNDYGLGLRLISVVAARAAFCILFCVTPFISMNGMKPVHITKKARATTGTFAGK